MKIHGYQAEVCPKCGRVKKIKLVDMDIPPDKELEYLNSLPEVDPLTLSIKCKGEKECPL